MQPTPTRGWLVLESPGQPDSSRAGHALGRSHPQGSYTGSRKPARAPWQGPRTSPYGKGPCAGIARLPSTRDLTATGPLTTALGCPHAPRSQTPTAFPDSHGASRAQGEADSCTTSPASSPTAGSPTAASGRVCSGYARRQVGGGVGEAGAGHSGKWSPGGARRPGRCWDLESAAAKPLGKRCLASRLSAEGPRGRCRAAASLARRALGPGLFGAAGAHEARAEGSAARAAHCVRGSLVGAGARRAHAAASPSAPLPSRGSTPEFTDLALQPPGFRPR